MSMDLMSDIEIARKSEWEGGAFGLFEYGLLPEEFEEHGDIYYAYVEAYNHYLALQPLLQRVDMLTYDLIDGEDRDDV